MDADELIERYLAADSAEALELLRVLGRQGAGVSHIWDACESKNPRFRSAGFDALARLPADYRDGHAHVLEVGIGDPNSFVAVAAISAAVALREHAVIDAVRATIGSENQRVAERAVLALGQLGDNSDTAFLLETALKTSDLRLAQRAARALHGLSQRDIVVAERVVAAANDLLDRFGTIDSPLGWQGSRAVVGCLRYAPVDDQIVTRLLEMFGTTAGVRDEIAITLAFHGVESARGPMEEVALIEESLPLRVALIGALAGLGIDKSLDVLREIDSQPISPKLRAAIVNAAATSVDPRADAIVLDAATSADITVRALTLEILEEQHHLLGELAVRGLTDPSPLVRIAAAGRLAGRPAMRDTLGEAARFEAHTDVQAALQRALNAAQRDDLEFDPVEFDPIRSAILAVLPGGDRPAEAATRMAALTVMTTGADPERIVGELTALADLATLTADRITASTRR